MDIQNGTPESNSSGQAKEHVKLQGPNLKTFDVGQNNYKPLAHVRTGRLRSMTFEHDSKKAAYEIMAYDRPRALFCSGMKTLHWQGCNKDKPVQNAAHHRKGESELTVSKRQN